MRTRYTSAATSLLLTALLGGVAGCGGGGGGLNIQPSSINVETRAKGRDGLDHTAPDVVLRLRHDADGQEPRLVLDDFADISRLQQVTIAATSSTGLPFPEEWHSLLIFHQRTQPGSDIVRVVSSGEPGWVDAHRGNMVWLIARHRDITLPADSFSNFTGIPAAGMFVLARKEDSDLAMPWTRNDTCSGFSLMPMAASLRPPATPGAADCFDMQSLTSAILNHIAVTVEDRITDFNNSSDPVESLIEARVLEHRIYFIPHVPEGPFPGFGFIYEASLAADVVGITGAHLTVSVPITFHWMRDPLSGRFSVNIDPLGPAFPGAPLVNDTRVAVSTDNGDLSEGFLSQINTKIRAGIMGFVMPTGPLGITFDSLLSAAFGDFFLGLNERLPENFSVLALPENQAAAGAPSNLVMKMGSLTVSDPTSTPGQPGGRGARNASIDGSGRVVVLRNRNAAGTSVRSFRLPQPIEVLPIKLYLLRK